jgi:L-ribulokinase
LNTGAQFRGSIALLGLPYLAIWRSDDCSVAAQCIKLPAIEEAIANGVPVNEIVTTGGLPNKNKLLMQIYADVTGRPMYIASNVQGGAVGSAMHGAVAAGKPAGGFDSIVEATQQMASLRAESYQPNPAHKEIYDQLYAEYVTLHDYFGRGANDVMKRLKELKAHVWAR